MDVVQNGVPDRLARASQQSTTGCGIWILLLSLAVLFFASLVAYLFVRYFGKPPEPLQVPALPPGLWVSTALLLASSGTLHWALSSARRDHQPGVRAGMAVTLLLGLGFLLLQVLNWADLQRLLVASGVAVSGNFLVVSFYFLTALHAAHVLGGVIPMGFVTAAAFRGFYTRTSHNGLRLLSMYWHFLDVVWLVLFTVLLATLR